MHEHCEAMTKSVDDHDKQSSQNDSRAVSGLASFNGSIQRFSYRNNNCFNLDSGLTMGSTEGTGNSSHLSDLLPPSDTQSNVRKDGLCLRKGILDQEQRKQRRVRAQKPTYVAPSRHAHLPLLSDVLAPNLLILFIGLNPGITTSQTGHAYAHPSNLFWKLLYSSGITDRRCLPEEDVNMPNLYGLGFTNIVSRPTRDQSELNRAEIVGGTPALEAKANEWQPEVCCLVGKGIWEAIYKKKHGVILDKGRFHYGWQDESENLGTDLKWQGSKVFVAASTSGLSASLKPKEKEAIWRPLGEWIQGRRAQNARTLQ